MEKHKKGGVFSAISANRDFLLVSLAIAFLFVLPHFAAIIKTPGYNYFSTDRFAQYDQDQFLYASRAAAYLNSHFSPDVMNYEHQSGRYPSELVEPAVFLALSPFAGGLFQSYLLLSFVFGFFGSLFMLLFLSRLFRSRALCVVIMLLALACMWFYYFPPWSSDALGAMLSGIFLNPQYYLQGSIGGSPLNPYSLFYSARLYYQLFCYPLLFLQLYLLCRGFDENKPLLALLGFAIAGIFAYSYIYFFMVSMTMLGLVLLYFLATRNIKSLKIASIGFIIAILISLPYLFSLYSFAKDLASAGLQDRLGAEYGSFFKSNLLALRFVAVAAALLAIVHFSGRGKVPSAGLAAALLALLLLGISADSSLQLVTGKNIQVHHFYAIGSVFSFIAVAYIISWFFSFVKLQLTNPANSELVLKVCAVAIILFYFAIQLNIGLHLADGETSASYASKQELYGFVDEKTQKDSVILSLSYQQNLELFANTGRYLFLPDGYLTVAPVEELHTRILLAYKFCNVSTQFVDSLLKGQEDKAQYYYFFHMAYKCNPSEGRTQYCDAEANESGIPDIRKTPFAVRQQLIADYDELEQDSILKQGKYKLDYLLVGNYERELGCRPEYSGAKEVFSNANYTLFLLHGN